MPHGVADKLAQHGPQCVTVGMHGDIGLRCELELHQVGCRLGCHLRQHAPRLGRDIQDTAGKWRPHQAKRQPRSHDGPGAIRAAKQVLPPAPAP